MIRFMRSRQCARNRKQAAVDYALNAAALAGEIFPEACFSVYSGLLCSVERIYWSADFSGLVDLERAIETIESDRRWQQFIESSPKHLFVEGSGRESVMNLEGQAQQVSC